MNRDDLLDRILEIDVDLKFERDPIICVQLNEERIYLRDELLKHKLNRVSYDK